MPAPALEFLAGGEIIPDSRWRMPPHHHSFHELIVVMDGAMRLQTPGQDFIAQPGDLLFYPAGLVHEEKSVSENPVNTFFISYRERAGAGSDRPLRLRDVDGRVRQMVAWLVRDAQAGGPAERLNSLLGAILAETRRLDSAPLDPWLVEARDYLQRNLSRTLYLDDIARRMRMSRFAFVRKFKRLSGRTPMQELRLMRLNQARTMMLTLGLPVKAIAAAVGLNDEFQLSKLFRRYFRLSPREMRSRARSHFDL